MTIFLRCGTQRIAVDSKNVSACPLMRSRRPAQDFNSPTSTFPPAES